MKRSLLFCLVLVCFSLSARADHISGGELFYTLTGNANNQYQYNVTVRLYMRCNSGRRFNDPTTVSVFARGSNVRIMDIRVPLAGTQTISIVSPDPCITNPPVVCYDIGTYNFSLSLPGTPDGYTISTQVNFRINGIQNLSAGYGNVGATYTAEIPGAVPVANGAQNNSARFTGSDLVVVCANNPFTYSFAADDSDGDQLRYSFCNAYVSGTTGMAIPPPPPYQSVPYGTNFSGTAPLGNNVQINTATGLISGIAPADGVYVVTVCVEEIRNGVVIATQRKDLQINIAACAIAGAVLEPEYLLCKETKSLSVTNLSTSPLITTTHWEFSNAQGTVLATSGSLTATYTFADTGLYTVRLVINRGQPCSDSTSAPVRVYPGFKPGFSVNGICFTKPTLFLDTTTTAYGFVDFRKWDFGETTTSADTASTKNAAYTYPQMGIKNIQLIATSSKGCRDTVVKAITIFDKPPLDLLFRDTLICNKDNVQLRANGNGLFSWSPNTNIIAANTAAPTVSPQRTTTYFVQLNDNGCINNDSVRVRVVDKVTVQAMKDTIICQGDTIQLRATSDGLQYAWAPASQVSNATAQNPFAVTGATTSYTVTAIIGSCSATSQVKVSTVPYPFVNAGKDTVICFNTNGQLAGSTNGSTVLWSPASRVSNTAILTPQTIIKTTTSFTLTAFDTRGCPKPATDVVQVIVLPPINAFAGRDTAVVISQPLQLNATGGEAYVWSPATGLSATDIANPIGRYTGLPERLRYKVTVFNEAGCADSAFVNVRVFKTKPVVFVPTAFTPNSDGLNDLLRPVGAGISAVAYFKVYNRWGQLVYATTAAAGWDGNLNGKPQSTGVYVWEVKATDFTGAPYFQKGTVTLIR